MAFQYELLSLFASGRQLGGEDWVGGLAYGKPILKLRKDLMANGIGQRGTPQTQSPPQPWLQGRSLDSSHVCVPCILVLLNYFQFSTISYTPIPFHLLAPLPGKQPFLPLCLTNSGFSPDLVQGFLFGETVMTHPIWIRGPSSVFP